MKTLNGVIVIDRATLRIIFTSLDGKVAHIPKFPNLYSIYTGDILVEDKANLTTKNCVNFKFDVATHTAKEVSPDSDSLMSKLSLTSRKFEVHGILSSKIAVARRSVHKTLYGQTEIYKMKEAQARNFRKSGYTNPGQYPLVTQYAEFTSKSPKQAADMILRKARDSNAVLARTEYARMVFKRSIFNATSFDQLGQVADNLNTTTL